MLVAVVSAACAYLPHGARAGDPAPIIQQGLPASTVPVFKETGAPNFSYPDGSTSVGGAGGAGGDGGGSGGASGGGGGYSGAGTGVGGATIAANYSQYVGESVGSGQCVALVQASSDVGQTSTWTPGEQVQGNTNIAPGTVIATFGADGTYTNTPGQSHAAIYLGQDANGIQVEDQFAGHAAYVHTIAWTTNNSYESGSKFYVVAH